MTGNGRTNGSPAILCEDVKKWFGDFQALTGRDHLGGLGRGGCDHRTFGIR